MSTFDYSGQWTARTADMFPYIVLDLDKTSAGSIGSAVIIGQDEQFPSVSCSLKLNTNKKKFEREVTLVPFSPHAGRVLGIAEVKQMFPNWTSPNFATLNFERLSKRELKVSAALAGQNGQATAVTLTKDSPPKYSYLDADYDVHDWKSFKNAISERKFHDFVFRGQDEPFSLKTTFHRTSRKDLVRYMEQDVRQLHHSVSGVVDHVFNIDIPQDLGALLNLAQHHGFPTPLLDWTYSPFVAAWFAFSKVSQKRRKSYKEDDKVRIFCLDKVELEKVWQSKNVTYSLPHTSLIDALR